MIIQNGDQNISAKELSVIGLSEKVFKIFIRIVKD